MPRKYFLQHIKTSSQARNGMMTFKVSQELTNRIDVLRIVEDNASYRWLGENDVDKNPITLAHYKIDNLHAFIRTKYIGTERHAGRVRPGNFIAHTLVQGKNDALDVKDLLLSSIWKDDIATEDVLGAEMNIEHLIIEDELIQVPFETLQASIEYFNDYKRANALAYIIDLLVRNEGLLQHHDLKIIIEDHALSLNHWFIVLLSIFPSQAVYQQLTFTSWHHDSIFKYCRIVGIDTNNSSLKYLLPPNFKSYPVNPTNEKFNDYKIESKFAKDVITAIQNHTIESLIEQVSNINSRTAFAKIDTDINLIPDFYGDEELYRKGEMTIGVFYDKYKKSKSLIFAFFKAFILIRTEEILQIVSNELINTEFSKGSEALPLFLSQLEQLEDDIQSIERTKNRYHDFALEMIYKTSNSKIDSILTWVEKYPSAISNLNSFALKSFDEAEIFKFYIESDSNKSLQDLASLITDNDARKKVDKVVKAIICFKSINSEKNDFTKFINSLLTMFRYFPDLLSNNIASITNIAFINVSLDKIHSNVHALLNLHQAENVSHLIPSIATVELVRDINKVKPNPLNHSELMARIKMYEGQNQLVKWIEESDNLKIYRPLILVLNCKNYEDWSENISKIKPSESFKLQTIKYLFSLNNTYQFKDKFIIDILNKKNKKTELVNHIGAEAIRFLLSQCSSDGTGYRPANRYIRTDLNKLSPDRLIDNLDILAEIFNKHSKKIIFNDWIAIIRNPVANHKVHNILAYNAYKIDSVEEWDKVFKLLYPHGIRSLENDTIRKLAIELHNSIYKCYYHYNTKEEVVTSSFYLVVYLIETNHKGILSMLLEFDIIKQLCLKNRKLISKQVEQSVYNETLEYFNLYCDKNGFFI